MSRALGSALRRVAAAASGQPSLACSSASEAAAGTYLCGFSLHLHPSGCSCSCCSRPVSSSLLPAAAAGRPQPQAPSAASVRHRSSSSLPPHLDLTLPSLRGRFADLAAVDQLAPQRWAVTPLLVPHGVLALPQEFVRQQEEAVEAACRPGGSAAEDSDEEEAGDDDAAIHAISIKTWRRLKMKKHKIRKRRRADRHKVK